MSNWVDEELSTLELGDKRRESRVKEMLRTMAQRPSGSIPQTFEHAAEIKAAYRLLSSDAVAPELLRSGIYDATWQRVSQHSFILAVQDTTHLHLANAGVEDFWVHSTLAVSEEGVPVGLLDQKVWQRDAEGAGSRHQRRQRPIEAKESFRWIESLHKVQAELPDDSTILTVADREADIFELFAQPRPEGSELLIRACRDRKVAGEHRYLLKAVQAAPVADEFCISLRRRPDRQPRDAKVQIRFAEVTLLPPTNGVHAPDLQPVDMWAILLEETEPADGHKPLSWLLLTTLEVCDSDAARLFVGYYAMRWLIERYHFVLKSGCGIEDSQLRCADALQRLLALYCIVAWRLLWLTYASRVAPQTACTVAFSSVEWQSLWRLNYGGKPLPQLPPSLRQATRMVASLGGFLGRKSDGEPGVKVLWRGLMRLQDIVIGVQLLTPPHQDVGNA